MNAGEWARIWDAIQRQKDLPLTSSEPAPGAERAHGGKIIRGRWLYRLAAAAAVIALAIIGFQMMQPSDTAKEIVRQPPSAEPSSSELSSSEEELDNREPDEDGEDSIAVLDGDAPDEIREDGVIYRDF